MKKWSDMTYDEFARSIIDMICGMKEKKIKYVRKGIKNDRK